MKKYFYAIVVFSLCCFTPIFSQDCAYGQAAATLETEGVLSGLLTNGNLWSSPGYIEGGHLVEEGGIDITTIFAGGLWIGGLDQGGNLKVAAETYGHGSQSDFWPGPLTQTGQTLPENCSNFDRFWGVNRDDILAFRSDWADNGMLDNPIPASLLAWPGQGNPHSEAVNGFTLPDSPQGLAPFYDENTDGIYDPEKGDYPIINEASTAYWYVINDAGGIHANSNGDLLLLEIQILAYVYQDEVAPINRAVFHDYRIINRAIENTEATYVGFWVDPDVGCYLDDYIGCDPSRNMGFAYNADAIDGTSSCQDCAPGATAFCGDIPMVGVKILEGTKRVEGNQLVDNGMSSFTYYSNSSVPPAPVPDTPTDALGFYYMLSGLWPDGTPMTTGGSGYDPGSTAPATSYAFPGSPADGNAWTMCSAERPLGDYRFLLSSGPFDMQPGQIQTMTTAVFHAYPSSYPCPSWDALTETADEIDEFHGTVVTSVTPAPASPAVGIEVSPNPMQEEVYFHLDQGNAQIKQVELFGVDGRQLRHYPQVNNQQLRMERGVLGSGMYFYRLQTSEGKWFSGKLVVQ